MPPINLNLLGLNLKTSQIEVNTSSQTGNGDLLGNVLTDAQQVVWYNDIARREAWSEGPDRAETPLFFHFRRLSLALPAF